MKRILKPIKMSKAKIIKLIEEKISKTRNKEKKEKLRELEDAVKEGKMQKVKRFTNWQQLVFKNEQERCR